jgi:hypothetical protein
MVKEIGGMPPHFASEICIKKAQILQRQADDADILNFATPGTALEHYIGTGPLTLRA